MAFFFKSELEKAYDELDIRNLKKAREDLNKISKPEDYKTEFEKLKVEIGKLREYYDNKLSPAFDDLCRQDIQVIFSTTEAGDKRNATLALYKKKVENIMEVLAVMTKTKKTVGNSGISKIINSQKLQADARKYSQDGSFVYLATGQEFSRGLDNIKEGVKKIRVNQVKITEDFDKLIKELAKTEPDRLKVKEHFDLLFDKFNEFLRILGEKNL